MSGSYTSRLNFQPTFKRVLSEVKFPIRPLKGILLHVNFTQPSQGSDVYGNVLFLPQFLGEERYLEVFMQ